MGWFEIIVSAITGLVSGGGLGAWMLKAYRDRNDNLRKIADQHHEHERADREDNYKRQSAHMDRLEKTLNTFQVQLGQSLLGESRCRETLAAVNTDNHWIYSILQGHHALLINAGIAIDPLPEMPLHQELDPARAQADFERRQAEHSSGLLRQEREDLEEGGAL